MAKEANEIVGDLESQVDGIMQMYEVAESAYSYENTRPQPFSTNEHLQRQNVAALETAGPTSMYTVVGSSLYGLAAMYLLSRRGAAGLSDLTMLKQCYFRSLSYFMLGTSWGTITLVGNAGRQTNQARYALDTRVVENEQTHNILRTLKFHFATRQMGCFVQDPR